MSASSDDVHKVSGPHEIVPTPNGPVGVCVPLDRKIALAPRKTAKKQKGAYVCCLAVGYNKDLNFARREIRHRQEV